VTDPYGRILGFLDRIRMNTEYKMFASAKLLYKWLQQLLSKQGDSDCSVTRAAVRGSEHLCGSTRLFVDFVLNGTPCVYKVIRSWSRGLIENLICAVGNLKAHCRVQNSQTLEAVPNRTNAMRNMLGIFQERERERERESVSV
jgi:hypothetical protein